MTLKPLHEIVARTKASEENQPPILLPETEQKEMLLNEINYRLVEASGYNKNHIDLESFFFRGYSEFVKEEVLSELEIAGYSVEEKTIATIAASRYQISWEVQI